MSANPHSDWACTQSVVALFEGLDFLTVLSARFGFGFNCLVKVVVFRGLAHVSIHLIVVKLGRSPRFLMLIRTLIRVFTLNYFLRVTCLGFEWDYFEHKGSLFDFLESS